MPAETPEEALRQAVAKINEQDMEGALAFYDEDALFVGPGGEIARGQDAIRAALGEYFKMNPTLTVKRLRKVLSNDNVALIAGDWTLTGTDPDGAPIEQNATNIDVARRQPDGRWLMAIDNPYGLD